MWRPRGAMWDSLAIRPLRFGGVFLQSDPEVRRNLCGAPKPPPKGGGAPRSGLQAGLRGAPRRTGTCLSSFSTVSPTARGALRPEAPASARGNARRRETSHEPNREPRPVKALNGGFAEGTNKSCPSLKSQKLDDTKASRFSSEDSKEEGKKSGRLT